MNIFGGFDLKLDSKGRVGLPPNFRKELGSHVIITDWIGKCISIYSIESWAEVYDKLNRSSKESVNGNDVKRCILAHAYSVEVDPEGRIHIPECLSSRVNIVRDVRVNGNGNRVEVWDQSTWKEYEGLSPTAECMTVCGEAAMLREKILHKLKEMRLEGMRAAYDEVLSIGQKRGYTAEKVLLSLLEAESAEQET